MGPFPVVQLDVFANGTPGMADRLVGLQVDLFVFDAAPYALDEHVIAPASLAVHRQPDAPAQYGRGERARRELGVFNRSSQHEIVEQILDARSMLLPESSIQASFEA